MISLYIHIPFCSSKCAYCDFYSLPVSLDYPFEKIIREILGQAEYFNKYLGSPKIETVYIGGGTPSLLPVKALEGLFLGLNKIFSVPEDFTIEANPESLSEDFLELCNSYGIGRLSIGLQSFKNRLLKKLGRRGSRKINLKTLDKLGLWKGEFSLDLLSGIPGQSRKDLLEDCFLASSYKPGHISLYSLSVEEGTALSSMVNKGDILLPSPLKQDMLWDSASEFLISEGYSNYEISNFAKPGKESLHNLRYWRMEPYLGCGPGAVSTIPGPTGPIRLTLPTDLESFLSGNKNLWGIKEDRLTASQFLTEHLIMGLRTAEGVSFDRIKRIFGIDLASSLSLLIETWKENNFLSPIADSLAFNHRGRSLLNKLLLDAAMVLDKTEPGFIAWPLVPP